MNSKKDIEDSFDKIASRISQLNHRPGTLCPIYLEGGASLYMHDVSDTFRDIDWFIPERWLKYNDIATVNQKSSKLNVDLQTNHLIEGFLPDYTHNAKLEKSVTHNGITFELRTVLPEMIFLKKLDVGRDKDFADLEKISAFISPEQIIEAINACIKINSEDASLNIASQALSEISCNYFLELKPNELKIKTQSLINSLELNGHVKGMLANSFGISLNKDYSIAKDPWINKAPAKSKGFTEFSI
jgi:hypothetical protein